MVDGEAPPAAETPTPEQIQRLAQPRPRGETRSRHFRGEIELQKNTVVLVKHDAVARAERLLLQRILEVDQICLLGGRQPKTEPEIVIVDQVLQVRGRAGVEERRSHREVAQDRRLEQPRVSYVTGYQRPAWIGGHDVGSVGPTRTSTGIGLGP